MNYLYFVRVMHYLNINDIYRNIIGVRIFLHIYIYIYTGKPRNCTTLIGTIYNWDTFFNITLFDWNINSELVHLPKIVLNPS